MEEVGYGALGIIPSLKDFGPTLERDTSKALAAAGRSGGEKFGTATADSARGRISSMAKTVVAPLAGAFAAIKVKDFLKDAITGASDLSETTNKVQQVFGDASSSIFKFSSTAAKALGQTNQQARDAASTFGIFGKVAKLTDKQNAKFSIRMTKLASDLASFHNTSPEQAIEAIGAAMRGEAEPIRAYGVLLDEATLKAEAMRIGLLKPVKDKAKIQAYQVAILEGQKKYNDAVEKSGKGSIEALKAEANLGTARDRLAKATAGSIPPLTQQQKVLAAQSAIMRQTTVAQGDFARTSGGLANQQRILTARWEDAKTKLGTALLPTVNAAVKYLNDKGIPAFERFADFFTKKGVPAIKHFADKAKPFIKDVLTQTRDLLKEAEPFAKGFVDAFNKLPKSVKTGVGTAALLGLSAKKLGVLGGPKGCLAGSVIGAFTKGGVQKVFVVNNSPGIGVPGEKVPKGPASKVGKFALGFGLPAAVAAATGIALEKGHPLSGMPPITGLAAKAIGGFVEKRKIDDQTASVLRQHDAWLKVRGDYDRGKTGAENLTGQVFKLDRQIKNVEGRKQTKIEAPNLLNLLDNVRRYGSMLDHLDGRTVTTFLTTVRRHQSGTGGTTDSGETLGKHSPTVTQRSAAGVQVNIDTVVAHDYADFMTQAQRRARRAALDGIRG